MDIKNAFVSIGFEGLMSGLLVNNSIDGSIDKLGVQIHKLQPSVIPGSKCEVNERQLDTSCLISNDKNPEMKELKNSFEMKTINLINFIKVNTFKLPRGSHHNHDNIHHQGLAHSHPLNSNESEFYTNSHSSVTHTHDGEPRVLNATNTELAQGRPQEYEEVLIIFLDEDPLKPYYIPLAF